MFFSTELLFKVKLDLEATSKKDFFLIVFMMIRLKYFHDSLNIAVILAPGHEVFSAKCAQFTE